MLFTGAGERARGRNGPAPVRVLRRTPGPSRDAWILLGDLDGALYQAGIVDAVIERIARPRVVFAGGASVLGAMLSLDGRAIAFRIGWERLRAAHVLGAAALDRAPFARLRRARPRRNGNGTREASFMPFETMRAAQDGSAPTLRVLRGGVFVDPYVGSQAAAGELIAASLLQRPCGRDLAAAIHESLEIAIERVLVFGADERVLESPEVARALNDARTAGTDVVVLALAGGERPGTIGYVLPGLGRADRLIESGREAARRWLAGEATDRFAL